MTIASEPVGGENLIRLACTSCDWAVDVDADTDPWLREVPVMPLETFVARIADRLGVLTNEAAALLEAHLRESGHRDGLYQKIMGREPVDEQPLPGWVRGIYPCPGCGETRDHPSGPTECHDCQHWEGLK
jgi:hypothetical protein